MRGGAAWLAELRGGETEGENIAGKESRGEEGGGGGRRPTWWMMRENSESGGAKLEDKKKRKKNILSLSYWFPPLDNSSA